MGALKTIAFLGPAGTYSDEAAQAFSKRLNCDDARLMECDSFHDVFEAVGAGSVDYGVVAMENSIEGPVNAVLDDFAARDDVTIVGEQVIDIHHCLLLNPAAGLDEVSTVASHPQGLAQCRGYIAEHLGECDILTTSSTSESARLAAANPHLAGIASAHAAQIHGAKIAAADIEDHSGDQTVFALIARRGTDPVFAGARSKTSLALFLNSNRPGALLMILSEFAYAGINLTKIQSRPTKRALGDYMFFVDVEGAADDPEVATALACLRLKLRMVKVLGSYPL